MSWPEGAQESGGTAIQTYLLPARSPELGRGRRCGFRRQGPTLCGSCAWLESGASISAHARLSEDLLPEAWGPGPAPTTHRSVSGHFALLMNTPTLNATDTPTVSLRHAQAAVNSSYGDRASSQKWHWTQFPTSPQILREKDSTVSEEKKTNQSYKRFCSLLCAW